MENRFLEALIEWNDDTSMMEIIMRYGKKRSLKDVKLALVKAKKKEEISYRKLLKDLTKLVGHQDESLFLDSVIMFEHAAFESEREQSEEAKKLGIGTKKDKINDAAYIMDRDLWVKRSGSICIIEGEEFLAKVKMGVAIDTDKWTLVDKWRENHIGIFNLELIEKAEEVVEYIKTKLIEERSSK